METRAPIVIMCDETDNTANRVRYSVEQQQRQQQLKPKDTSGSKAPSTLLHLPLVLVCDILEHIVHSYTSRGADEIFPLLRLRRVNSEFHPMLPYCSSVRTHNSQSFLMSKPPITSVATSAIGIQSTAQRAYAKHLPSLYGCYKLA
jgi:hypothetical protein